jgi:hypothetical protein
MTNSKKDYQKIHLHYVILMLQAQSHITITFNYVNGTWVPVVPAPASTSYELATQVMLY